METIIKVNPSELNEDLLDKIKKFIGGRENVDVTISLKDLDPEYAEALNRSIEEAENSDSLVSFTMEDFMAYAPAEKM
jgi:hypothetical protein